LKVEDLRKSLCKGDGGVGASATHFPIHFPTFAQKFAQLAFVRNTVCNKNGNHTQTYIKFDSSQNLCNTVRNTQLQPKTTTNKLSNPKDASNIHSPHHHYHIGFPHN
jgi:hypothetical protein